MNLLKLKYPEKIKEPKARGLMLAIEFQELLNGELIGRQLFENGFVVGYKMNTVRFLPPLTIKDSDIDHLISKLDELCKGFE